MQAEIDRAFLNGGTPLWWTPITYALLHANWAHVGFNALWLAAFGAPVARRFGNQRFIAFCIGGAIAGALAHLLTHLNDLQPVIGALAIDSATMAAAICFIFQPGAPLGASLGWGDPRQGRLLHAQPALPLWAVFTDSRAMTFLIFWFADEFYFGPCLRAGNCRAAASPGRRMSADFFSAFWLSLCLIRRRPRRTTTLLRLQKD